MPHRHPSISFLAIALPIVLGSPPSTSAVALEVAGIHRIAIPAFPRLISVAPSEGPTTGSTWVTIEGGGIVAGARVHFGALEALATEWVNPTRIRALSPAQSAGVVDLSVENRPGYAATMPAAFAYYDPPPAMIARHFDALDLSLNGGEGYKSEHNENALLAWGESYVMMAYLASYQATGEIYYLHKLVDHADAVLANRDDHRGVSDYRGISGACWINRHYQSDSSPYCYVVHSGMITYPMARFAVLVYSDPQLWDVETYDQSTLAEKADLYLLRAEETVAHHEWQWRDGPGSDEGYYLFAPDAPGGIPAGLNLPSNQQNALGRTIVALYQATGDTAYRDKAAALANLFVRAAALDGDAYVWDYWNLIGDTGFDGPGEDISHAAINVDFAALAHHAGVVFDATDMQRFAATFTDNVIAGEAAVFDRVDGGGGIGSYEIQAGRWLNLGSWDSQQEMWFTVQGVYEELFDWVSTGSGSLLAGVANLALWESELELRGVYTGNGSASDWAGCAAGDLDGDGLSEICALRNFDGGLFCYDLNPATGGVSTWGWDTSLGSDWVALAAADLDQDGRDELIAPSHADAQIHFIDSDGAGSFDEAWHTTGWGAASEWAGVGAGVFEAGARPWVALARNFDGSIMVADYDMAGNGEIRASNLSFGAESDWADLAAGDFDGDGLAEIVAARNSDAHIFILDRVGSELTIIHEISGFGPASEWAAVAAADLDADGVDEILAARNFDGMTYAWKLVDGSLQTFGYYKRLGATHSFGPMAGGRLARGWNGDMLVGWSNRTGNLQVYGVRP